MENIINQLPIEWYIAKIKYLRELIDCIPTIKNGIHSGKPVLRIRRKSNVSKYSEVTRNSKHWDETYSLYQQQLRIKLQLETLKKELKSIYNTTFEREEGKYIIRKDTNSKLNMDFFRQLKDNECTFENKYKYELDDHNFRSRFEMTTAGIIKDLHINYKYDSGIHLYLSKDFTDFVLAFPEFNRCVFYEIMGMLDNINYAERNSKKLENYSLSGYYLGQDVFILGSGENSMPNDEIIKQSIINIVNHLCTKYVIRKY